MCLITFAYKAHPKYDLILAGNRDEFYGRPTRKAQFWTDEGKPNILAGKDLEAGGTWLGVNKDGRWSALTNYRDPSIKKEDPPSRGEIVLDYLKNQQTAMDYLAGLSKKAELYNGFNLLVWDHKDFYHYSNQNKKVSRIEPGIHGLSNALLDTPWPKLERANQQLKTIISEDNFDKEELFKLLADERKAPDTELPVTGIPKELEKAVSSIFIKTENYGSRCSTVLLIDKEGTIDFTERRFKPGTTQVEGEQHFSI
ncbi:MAG: NRDE family protein [Gracilimonas sp.]|uniref:NRDE family protein n=1 Tax=Gracilimonas TaxID=649462 RepID=UPI001B0E1A6A|nr:NRDE family protein [Gracilimonas sp.]MBO6587323.1 NRDE family protein [Gracilimonas sp.]MBO6614189.1 NRDE family protein [Gracilimonas sp.]